MRRLLAVVSVIVSVIVSSLAIGLGISSTPVAAVPPGFTDTQVPNPAGNNLSSPTGISALPGGRALITEKAGNVRILLANGTLLANDALSLSVCTGSEMGLLGAAADPAFIVNGFVYLYYSHATPGGNCNDGTGRANRVSRFTMSANTIIPQSEVILLDNIPATGGNHDGGDLEVGQDGYLYVAVGDAGTNPRGGGGSAAQDFSLLLGKIVRIRTDGGVPADNPFVGVTNAASCATSGVGAPSFVRCTETFAYGLRNPYRFAFDPNVGTTRFFINDVGQGTWEEVDEGIKGANYGWSSREGFCVTGSTTNCSPPAAGVTDPLTAYGHSTGCTYITAAAFVPNGVWPKQYDNSYLFADGGCNRIWQRTAAGAVDYANPFHTGSGVITDMAFIVQPGDPALYYVTNGNSQLRKITYDAPAPATSGTLAYTPLATSSRVYDTRDNTGVLAGPVRGGSTRLVDLGIDNSAVKAALVNLTMVQPVGPGFVWASQARTELPSTSNVNAGTGEFVANASIVPVDADGNITVFASTTTDLVIDVLGVFQEVAPTASGGRYNPLSPSRLIDTRLPATANGNSYTRSSAGPVADVRLGVSGLGGVPATVQAVALIVTGISNDGSPAGFVSAYATGTPLPPTSILNVNGSGDIRPNLVIVPVGGDGTVSLRISNVDDVVVDVAGYFAVGTSPTGLYHVVAPSRQADSRSGQALQFFQLGTTQSLDPGSPVPNGAKAISQNVTMTETFGPGFVTAFPADEVRPLASNGNTTGINQDRSSLTLTKVGTNGSGSVSYFVSGGAHLVVDITGYFD